MFLKASVETLYRAVGTFFAVSEKVFKTLNLVKLYLWNACLVVDWEKIFFNLKLSFWYESFMVGFSGKFFWKVTQVMEPEFFLNKIVFYIWQEFLLETFWKSFDGFLQ